MHLLQYLWSSGLAAALLVSSVGCGDARPSAPEQSSFVPAPSDSNSDSPSEGDGNTTPGDDDDGASQGDDDEPSDGLAPNGEDCSDNAECSSNICADSLTGPVCSECAEDSHCPVDGQSCVFDPTAGFRQCSAGELGDLCQSDAGCDEGACRIRPDAPFGLCSDCRDAEHCRELGNGINCTMDLNAGYYRCSAGELGEECYDSTECISGICRPEGEEAGYGKCSECMTDADCVESGEGPNCTNKVPQDLDDPTYFHCGTGALGEKCESDAACLLERCMEEHCSECQTSQQCRDAGTGRNCVYRSIQRHTGWHMCTEGNSGEPCTEDESCMSKLYCAARFPEPTCSECASDDHCGDGLVCSLGYPADTRLCVASKSLPTDTYCEVGESGEKACAGYCVALPANPDPHEPPFEGMGVCGECRPGGDDCGSGQTCVPPEHSSGLGPTGSVCVDAD